MLRTVRFLRAFRWPSAARVRAEETTYRRGGETLEATLYVPSGASAPLPGWVTLHGLTYHGRRHPSLERFARALAASGAVVMVPDIPEWRALNVAPSTTVPTIRAAVLALDARAVVAPGRVAVMGFSFGGTQALIASTDPALEGHLAGVASWGGYADLRRVARFMFTGEHEVNGRVERIEPDPYGRWILAGDYLRLLPEHADDAALADALKALALEAGRRMIMAWEPALDRLKAELGATLDARARAVFHLFAPTSDRPLARADLDRLRTLADRLSDLVLAREPLMDPAPFLPRVPVPVMLAHGRGDRLMPYTELDRLRRALPSGRVAAGGVTTLFAHSFGEKRLPTPALALDAARFLRLLRAMINLARPPGATRSRP